MLDLQSDPFQSLLGPLAGAMADPEVSLLLAGGPWGLQRVRRGVLRPVDGALEAGALERIAELVAADTGAAPGAVVLRGRGTRGEALVLVRGAVDAGLVLALHLPLRAPVALDALHDADLVPALVLPLLRAALRGRRGLLLVAPPPALDGGLLQALVREVQPGERIVWLLTSPALVPEGCLGVTLPPDDPGAVLDAALALRPDRVVAASLDARGAGAFLHAAAGVAGSLACVEAVDARGALARVLALACAGGLSLEASRALVAAALSLVVVVGRLPDQRLSVVEVAELTPSVDGVALHGLFACAASADDEAAVPVLVPTGRLPSFLPSLVPLGAQLDPALFDPARHGLQPAARREPSPAPAMPPVVAVAPGPAVPTPPSLSPPALRRGLAPTAAVAAPPAAAPDPTWIATSDLDSDDPGWEVEVMDRSNHGRSAQDLSTLGPETPPVSLVGGAAGESAFAALLRAKHEASQGVAASPRAYVPHPPPMHPLAQELGLEPPPDPAPASSQATASDEPDEER